MLIGLLSTIYARILPGLEVSDLRMFVGIAVYVVINAAISIAFAKRAGTREGLAGGLRRARRRQPRAGAAGPAPPRRRALDASATVFFVLLLSLLVTMHDRFAPVAAVRAEHDRTDPEPGRAASPPEYRRRGSDLGGGQLAEQLRRAPVDAAPPSTTPAASRPSP